MNQKYTIGVMIGRFQPPHKAHITIIEDSLKIVENLIIVIGSHNSPRTPKNPFTAEEREVMIVNSLPENMRDRVLFAYMQDCTYNTQEWVRNIQDAVLKTTMRSGWSDKISTVLIGHHKDSSSYYLDMFPQWDSIEIPLIDDLHSTDIRDIYFDKNNYGSLSNLPEGVKSFLNDFQIQEEYKTLCEEYEYIKSYKEQWKDAPYPPTFVTVDAIVIQSGHVLLVKRRASPGKGLYALPGGFLDPDETLKSGMIRELREETKLKVPEPVLLGNIRNHEVYDYPTRSLRGRTITHAFLIELPCGPLPKVKGSSDAEKAVWIPLNIFYSMQGKMFEDHWAIVESMIGHLGK